MLLSVSGWYDGLFLAAEFHVGASAPTPCRLEKNRLKCVADSASKQQQHDQTERTSFLWDHRAFRVQVQSRVKGKVNGCSKVTLVTRPSPLSISAQIFHARGGKVEFGGKLGAGPVEAFSEHVCQRQEAVMEQISAWNGLETPAPNPPSPSERSVRIAPYFRLE